MDTDRWHRLSPLLDELFELVPSERAQRLRDLRCEDRELADEIEALIALEDGHDDFLAEPFVPPLRGAQAGTSVGPYRLESLLGEGGMGQVWLAVRADGLYQRRLALKLLRPGMADTNLRLRFTRERQILARLAHPHIARLLDAGISSDNLPYLALEHVDGKPITDYCREHRVPLAARLKMFHQICDAVSHAHANLIVHRDLKPSNILVTPAGEVRLLDFGIAKLLDSDAAPEQTRTGVRAFTLHYAAPEQIRGEPVTTMTDVYSLGVVLYELLTDHKPYRLKRNSDAEWEEAILAVDPLRPSQSILRAPNGHPTAGNTTGGNTTGGGPDNDPGVLRKQARELSGDLDNIVLKTLSKRPEHRYPSVEALSQDLLRYESGRPVHARAQSLGYRFRKYVRRHRWSLASGALAALVLSTALTVIAWQAREAVQEAGRAQAMQDFMLGVFEQAGGTRDGESLDLRKLLDTSVERGNRELLRQPRARAELLGAVARLRIGLGDYAVARDLLGQQAAIIATTPAGPAGEIPSSLRLEAITQHGRVMRLLDDPRACIELMQPVLAEAQREQVQLPVQATAFFTQLGRCRRANGERRTARQLFEKSLELRRANGHDAVGEAENLMDIAGLQSDTGEVDIAVANLHEARNQLLAQVGDRHPLLADIGRELGLLLLLRGNLELAEDEVRSALALARESHGAPHPVTLSLMRQLASVELEQGRLREAGELLQQVQAALADRLPPQHPEIADSHLALGLVAWQRGDLDAARDQLARAVAIRRAGNDPAATAEALFQLAKVLHAGGRDPEARSLLLEAREWRRQRYGNDHPIVGHTDRLLGEVEIASGQTASGRARLERAARMTRSGYGASHPFSRMAEFALAREHLRSPRSEEQGAAALARVEAMARLAESDLALRETVWRARLELARHRCHGEQRAQVLRDLQALGGRLQQVYPEGSAVARDAIAVASECGLPAPERLVAVAPR